MRRFLLTLKWRLWCYRNDVCFEHKCRMHKTWNGMYSARVCDLCWQRENDAESKRYNDQIDRFMKTEL